LSIGSHRLLGFAFASADLLLEISSEGQIAIALGASETISGSLEQALVGKPWRLFVDAADHAMLSALFEGLEVGQRGGPVTVRLTSEDGVARAASVCAFRLPDNAEALSCALSLADPNAVAPAGELVDRKQFEELTSALLQTAQATGANLELALIELSGLNAVREKTSPAERKALESRLAGVLRAQAHGGQAATELGDDRFALVRARGERTDVLTRRVARLLNLGLDGAIRPTTDVVPLKVEGGSRQAVRALRYSLDSYLREGSSATPADLSDALNQAMQRTLDEAEALGAAIRDKRFRLVYQPVVRVKDGVLHHYETLVRFGDEGSPFPLIRMAEELELIEQLDLAILERAVQVLGEEPKLRLAVNVSGRTIGSSGFIEQACAMIADNPKCRGRLMFELTESAALDDLELADRHLQALRKLGCEICLDDFGAGAASLAYLQQLRLDVLKIDGRYIRDLQHGGREATFVKHLVKMCCELGVQTLAEMVETQDAEDAIRRAGVDLAQGWLYGAAQDMASVRAANNPIKTGVRPALFR
jgi:EAL domain-containing protein (putative c-di-GMP-specific phosphodiesterase class I)